MLQSRANLELSVVLQKPILRVFLKMFYFFHCNQNILKSDLGLVSLNITCFF